MEIKNEALKSLYEDLVAGYLSFCVHAESPIDAAFKKCDDELEKENSLAFCRIKQLEDANHVLEKEINDLKKQNHTLGEKCLAEAKTREYWRQLCNERGETIRNHIREKEDLKRQLDTECKKRCDIGETLDDIGKRYYESAQRVGMLEREKEVFRSQLEEANDTLEKVRRENKVLKQQFDSLTTARGRLQKRYEEEVACRRKWAKLAGYRDKRIEELQLQIDTLKYKPAGWVDPEACKFQGMEELWAMLGNMYAADPFEVSKIFGWFSINNIAHYTSDVKEFLKKYETWKSGKDEKETEQKRLAYMRDYLHRFCLGKVCCGCPLNTPELKCYGHGGFESISDEEVQRYYEKARGCGRFQWGEKKEEEKPSDEVPCSFGWKLDGTEYSIETSIPRKDYDNIVKIISGKE